MSNPNTIDLSGLSKQYAARDLPGERMLKYREQGQGGPEEIRREKKELKRELEERERLAQKKDTVNKRLSIIDKETSEKAVPSKKSKPEVNLDADEILPDSDSESDSDKNSDEDSEGGNSEDDDDDDTEALMAELNKIKKERAIEAAKQEADRKAKEEKIRVENILKGNPLLNPSVKDGASSSSEFKVKRRWDDDVVFKNCAKMDEGKKKDFINDTLRSEFHRKFMDRYVN